MIFNVSYTRPFLRVLSQHLLSSRQTLIDDTVILPSNRACLSLRNTLLQELQKKETTPSLFLPRIMTMEEFILHAADPDDLQRVISEEERLFLMTRLLIGKGERPEKAFPLSKNLLSLLDELETKNTSLASLKEDLSENLSRYFDETLSFLNILMDAYPLILRERGQRSKISLMQQLLTQDLFSSVRGHVIAAGFRASDAITLAALKQIADRKNGTVVLYGASDAPKAGQTHPAFEARKMLDYFETDFSILQEFEPDIFPVSDKRLSLITDVMRPAETTDAWLSLDADPSGLRTVTLKDDASEAKAVAILIKQHLFIPGETVMVVTENKTLSRKIIREAALLGIAVNDSAGTPLLCTKEGIYFSLLSELVHDGFSPPVFLALIKHPLYTAGTSQKEARQEAEKFETLLRDQRQSRLSIPENDTIRSFRKLFDAPAAAFETLFKAHIETAEILAASDDQPGPARLYLSEEGRALKETLDLYLPFAKDIGMINPFDYAALFNQLLLGHAARKIYSQHPRVRLLGPIEAHLETADTVIVSDLNEGSFPKEVIADPFLNRMMRRSLGLILPEESIGREAHMFSSALGHPNVILTRSLKKEGRQQTSSRWLLRLKALLKDKAETIEDTHLQHWIDARDLPTKGPVKIDVPQPRPGAAFCPRQVNVTDIERWIADPYSIYCKYVLRLKPLDPLIPPMLKQKYGTLIHRAIDLSLKHPDKDLLAIGLSLFREARISLFWQAKFRRIAAWFKTQDLSAAKTEISLQSDINGILVKGRADAVTHDAVIDYKTGSIPPLKQVKDGSSPQLPLLAYMLGGAVFNMEYWHLTGEDIDAAGKIIRVNKTPEEGQEIIARTLTRIETLFADYLKDDMPYFASANPHLADYEHLSRRKEWSRQ